MTIQTLSTDPFTNGSAILGLTGSPMSKKLAAVSFEDAGGDPYGSLNSGTIELEVKYLGSDQFQYLSALQLFDGGIPAQRAWPIIEGAIISARFTMAGAPAGAYCVASVSYSEDCGC